MITLLTAPPPEQAAAVRSGLRAYDLRPACGRLGARRRRRLNRRPPSGLGLGLSDLRPACGRRVGGAA